MPDGMGHNNPPDPIDEALAPFSDAVEEAQNWLDGEPVKDEAAMKAVDALLADVKAAHKAVSDGEKSAAAPLYDIWKAEKARWRPTLDDLDRIKKGLVSIVGDFKAKLAREKAEAERKAREEAERKAREAAEAAAKADAADIEAVREAAEAQQAAEEAARDAARASKEKVKGLRTVYRYTITDHRAALHDIAVNDRDAITAFVDEYVRRNFKQRKIEGVNVCSEKVAF